MTKSKKQELTIFLIIVGIATFFRLYQIDISKMPIATMDTIMSPLIGILTVLGLYLLTKDLFEWRLAAIASYLTAISFWHVSFSRIESSAIIIPFALVYAFYFLWRGIKKSHLPSFFISGIFGGIGYYVYNPLYCVVPFIAVVLFINYWWYLKNDFSHEKYEYAKTKLLQGFVILALTFFVVALPAWIYFWQHSGELLAHIANPSISNIIQTLRMFNFTNNPILPWPIGIFFVIGFINELIHWLKRKHGHFSTVHTFMFAWFFIMLIPGFLSLGAPNSLTIIGTLPAVMIFTARGIWWFFDKLNSWYKINDPHSATYGGQTTISHEAHAITALVMIIFLFSIGFMEYWRYFK